MRLIHKACWVLLVFAVLVAFPGEMFGAPVGDEAAGTNPTGALNGYNPPGAQTRPITTEASGQTSGDTNESSASEGTVRVNSSLNVRTGPWGQIIGSLTKNKKVQITGRSGEWLQISYNGRTAYVHSNYVDCGGSSRETEGVGDGDQPTGNTGAMQTRIVQEAQKLVGRRNFPYAPATNGGRLGCAQVVSTALQAAGVIPNVSLGVLTVLSDLRARGWREVRVPPYQAGDVITWKTYDRNGDGANDADTHIGIIMQNGNSVQAMSNSSSQRMPRLHSATYMPVSRVMRKV